VTTPLACAGTGTAGMMDLPTTHREPVIDDAARWLVALADTTGMTIVPELKTRFGLTAREAVEAIRAANVIRRAAT